MAEHAGSGDLGELAERYAALRPRLVGVAYALLGSTADAEDVVADTWLRLAAADAPAAGGPVRDVEAWSVVAVSRRALDVLRSARVRREAYVGPWLPEPVVVGLGADPAETVTLADEVHYALLALLERLSPAERTAWVLHDVFGMGFDEVAGVVGRTPAAVRQLASRARRHLAAERVRRPVARSEHDAVVGAFALAATAGDLDALVRVLDPDVVLTGDGGGVVSSARRPVHGADRVGRFLVGTLGRQASGATVLPVEVNGRLGFALVEGGAVTTVASLTVADGRILRVDLVRNPAKLPTLPDIP
ncbi:RNA polymerase sigma factor SigJ [Nocardioides zeae]|uniref:RNA polymerase sigma factor SigJ n=1 Tax=Nocardioides imazamoxiresistens TaxID=3231893 RepID=A0ABU3PUG4_9ACTN|nr:RNA polymerase sigma factor SigJ [Nocardioides zeae]MDT9592862.1 RNA polymerase sigma factor SigJ [Nocardioides zeae]